MRLPSRPWFLTAGRKEGQAPGNVPEEGILSEWPLSLYLTAWDLPYHKIIMGWGTDGATEAHSDKQLPELPSPATLGWLAPGHGVDDSLSRNVSSRRSHCLTLGFSTCLPYKNKFILDLIKGKKSFSQSLLCVLSMPASSSF